MFETYFQRFILGYQKNHDMVRDVLCVFVSPDRRRVPFLCIVGETSCTDPEISKKAKNKTSLISFNVFISGHMGTKGVTTVNYNNVL